MSTVALSIDREDAIRSALVASWSQCTQEPYDPAYPSYNQCAQTAIVVRELCGGQILKTIVRATAGYTINHFYNCIGGKRYDFTADQFQVPGQFEGVTYSDIVSSVEEAATGLQRHQIDAMRSAFNAALKGQYAG